MISPCSLSNAPTPCLSEAETANSGRRSVPRRTEMKAGDVIGGKYVLLQLLGSGGMGQVWSARNEWTGAEVAVKALRPELASSSDAPALIGDEARATAQLSHRSIVRVFDLVELDPGTGCLLIVMELLRGHSLAQRLDTLGPLSIDQMLAVALPILSALSHAHGAGIIHRDVKPGNVFLALEPDGRVFPKLVDFGVSQTREWGSSSSHDGGEVVGTPLYMSPEQARGEDVDARSDVFGVGVLLYECLSGTNPFGATGPDDDPHSCSPAAIESIPPKLWSVIARALAERPEERYSSAAEMARALRGAVSRPRLDRVKVRSRVIRILDFFAMVVVAAALGFQVGVPITSAQESAATVAAHMSAGHSGTPALTAGKVPSRHSRALDR
jgi:eukaryotic-like serine/threonine-protein kinase